MLVPLLSLGTAFVALFISPMSAMALEIKFDQKLIQGALLTGQTDAKFIEVLGKTVAVDGQGRFVFGLARDTSPSLELSLVSVSGERRSLAFDVEQRQYDIQSIDGIASKYVSPPKEVLKRISDDAKQVRAARRINNPSRYDYLGNAEMPAQGRISGVYGSQRIFNGVPKRPHFGLDIAAPTGTPVNAPLSGVVTLVHDDMYYSGGTLIIDHGRGVSSTFIHLSRIDVKPGDEVTQGQLIGAIGASGRATGPHLDWRINWFDQRLDPELLLQEQD